MRLYDAFKASEPKKSSNESPPVRPEHASGAGGATTTVSSGSSSNSTRIPIRDSGAGIDELAAVEAKYTREIAMLKQSLEQEKQRWLQEQRMEQTQWKRRLEVAESARMQELEEEWARREEERSSLVRSAQGEYERLEKTLRVSLLDLEARERRLAIAETALQREQQTQREENELVRKRLQSEQTHALSLAHKQSEALEKRVSVLERQLSDAEKRARLVEADFAEYRLQQRKVPESRLREEISALKGSLLELEKQKMEQVRLREIAEANASTLTLQLEKMARLVQNEKKKNEARVADELEKLRVKYVAREEKYVLDGDREELRAIKKQLDELRGMSFWRTSFGVNESRELPSHRHRNPPAKARSPVSGSLSRTRDRVEPHGSMHRSFSQQHWRSSVQPLQPVQLQRHEAHTSRKSSSATWRGNSSWPRTHHGQLRPSVNDSHSPVGNDADDDDPGGGDGRSTGELDDRSRDGSSEYYEHESDRESDDGAHIYDEDGDDLDEDRASLEFYEERHQIENDDQFPNVEHHVELERLERERKLLLASGAYNEHSYLVRELTRLIDLTKSRDTGEQDSPID